MKYMLLAICIAILLPIVIAIEPIEISGKDFSDFDLNMGTELTTDLGGEVWSNAYTAEDSLSGVSNISRPPALLGYLARATYSTPSPMIPLSEQFQLYQNSLNETT